MIKCTENCFCDHFRYVGDKNSLIIFILIYYIFILSFYMK